MQPQRIVDVAIYIISRQSAFYPQSLEKGQRSECALRLALAEMYVQGVSTRKVTEITEQMLDMDISSSEVSRCAKLLDDKLIAWRQRPLGEMLYLMLDRPLRKSSSWGRILRGEQEVHWRQFCSSTWFVGRTLHCQRRAHGFESGKAGGFSQRVVAASSVPFAHSAPPANAYKQRARTPQQRD